MYKFGCDDYYYTREDADKRSEEIKALERIDARIESGEIIEQKAWEFIKELNSCTEARLDAIAIEDGRREYTYRQMFRKWDQYAAVFSALDITGRNHSRVLMGGCPATETILSLYALNMTGTSVSFIHHFDGNNMDMLRAMVEKEHVTDIILPDYKLERRFLKQIMKEKDEMGIRNVIILHIPMLGWFAKFFAEIESLEKLRRLREIEGVLFMSELLREYGKSDICYAEDECDHAAVIEHTSGSTTGIRKPVPVSDRGINETAARMLGDERYSALQGKAVSILIQDLSSSYACMDMMNLPLAYGGKVVALPMLELPDVMAASLYYGANVIFGLPIMLEDLMKVPVRPDLSDVELIFIGGAYVSADTKNKINKYLKKCRFDKGVTVGYGLTEAGGACIVAPVDMTTDAIGYPFSGIKIKLYDEDENKFYDLGSGPRTGVMYMSSPSVSCGRIDDTVFFELEEIDGEQYLNTFDLVREGEDGELYYEGRMNKYFVNNSGVRFDAGLVEKAVAAQADIENCGLVPGYGRYLRDTVPVLYVKTRKPAKDSEETVRKALIQAFIKEGVIKDTNLPTECVITDDIHYSASGKIDTRQIATGNVDGYRYNVLPVRVDGELKDIKLGKYDGRPWIKGGLPEELDKN